MKRKILIGLFSVMLISIGASYAGTLPQRAQQDINAQYGVITGRVFDPEGRPVSKAHVYAQRSDFSMGKIPSTYTDNQGNFLLKVWKREHI
jgi:hypothetical protein